MCSIGRASAKKRRSNSPDWIASRRKLDWHVSGHRQWTKCHRGNDEPQLCTYCNRESTAFSISPTSDRLNLHPLFVRVMARSFLLRARYVEVITPHDHRPIASYP